MDIYYVLLQCQIAVTHLYFLVCLRFLLIFNHISVVLPSLFNI